MRSYTGNPEPDANRRDARSPEPRREGADPADPAPDGPADNPGTRRHARTCLLTELRNVSAGQRLGGRGHGTATLSGMS